MSACRRHRLARLLALPFLALPVMELVAQAGEAPPAPAPAAAPALAWVDLSDYLAGTAKGITLGVVVPGSDQLIVGLPERGLWTSANGGKGWTQLGKDAALQHPYQLIFDPADPKIFWVSSRVGPGLFTTSDAGATLSRLGNLDGVAGFGVDFSDPKRKTIVACRADKDREVQRSINAGAAFSRIGNKMPDKLLSTNHVLVFDAKTYVVATVTPDSLPASSKKTKDKEPKEATVHRSDDGGTIWFRVTAQGANTPPLTLANGTVLWPAGSGEGIQRSSDRGKTWTMIPGPARGCPIEMPKGWLAAVGDQQQILVSTDGGRLWEPVGPALPFTVAGIAFCEARHCFYAWHGPGVAGKESLMRLDLPEKMEDAIEPAIVRDLMVWNGDEQAKGASWSWPKEAPMVAPVPQSEQVRAGKSALRFHAENAAGAGAGWNWQGWNPADSGVDVTGMQKLVFALKVTGSAMPTMIKVRLACSTNKGVTKDVDITPYCPRWNDGKWHDVVVPMTELTGATFDAKKAWELGFALEGKPINADLFVDEIGFSKAP